MSIEIIPECVGTLRGQPHIRKHAFQLLRELETPSRQLDIVDIFHSHLHLELCDHSLLSIVGRTAGVQQPSGQMVLVVPFELVFIRQEPKQYNCLLQRDIDFVLCFLYVSSISLVATELLTAFVPFFKCS